MGVLDQELQDLVGQRYPQVLSWVHIQSNVDYLIHYIPQLTKLPRHETDIDERRNLVVINDEPLHELIELHRVRGIEVLTDVRE